MAFPVEEKYITETENKLNVKFPEKFKARMMRENGGELIEKLESEEEDCVHWLFPFFDKSDKNRISRTCNHIELETKNAHEWREFPKNGIAIGHDGSGNKLVLIHNGNRILSDEIYFWNHETGQSKKIADSIESIDKSVKGKHKVDFRKTKREKVNSLKYKDLEIDSVPSPWKLYKSGNHFEFQLGKNSNIKVQLEVNLQINDWNDNDFWVKQWESITKLKVKSNKEVIHDELENMEIVTCKIQGWSPVLTWARKKENSSWTLVFKTELRRLQGDMNELKKLLKKIQ